MGNPLEGIVFIPQLWYNEGMVNPCYIAGLVDGEGYIGLLPSKAKGLVNKSFEPVVKIGMTGIESRKLFERMKAQYGGTIELRSRPTKGMRQAYTYTLKSRKKVSGFLEDIVDELVIKQDQALLLLEFCYLPMTHSRHKTFSQSALERKQAIYDELKRLKLPPAETN